MSGNGTQTTGGNMNIIKTIIENTGKTVTDRTNTEVKRGAKDATSKFFTPIQQNVLTPANKY